MLLMWAIVITFKNLYGKKKLNCGTINTTDMLIVWLTEIIKKKKQEKNLNKKEEKNTKCIHILSFRRPLIKL